MTEFMALIDVLTYGAMSTIYFIALVVIVFAWHKDKIAGWQTFFYLAILILFMRVTRLLEEIVDIF